MEKLVMRMMDEEDTAEDGEVGDEEEDGEAGIEEEDREAGDEEDIGGRCSRGRRGQR